MNNSVTPADWLIRFLLGLEVNRAVAYAIAGRAWQFLAGPVSMVLIALFFSSEQQGYFYTFGSLMAVQVLVELGLHTVVVNVVSHEWARLGLDEKGAITGGVPALERLTSLFQVLVRWYAAGALLFVVGVTLFGWWFLGQREPDAVDWQWPWIMLALLNGILFWALPFTAVLEGCNQVNAVHGVRFGQAVTGSLAVWLSIIMGLGLWTVVVAALVRVIWEVWLIAWRYRRFFGPLFQGGESSSLVWKEEVWPLQWRIGVRSVVGYFAYNLIVPVMFHYHGPEEAGRMGMTWTALTALDGAANAWIQTRIPVFGMLISQRSYTELDRLFGRVLLISTGFLVAGGSLLVGVVALLPVLPWELTQQLSLRLLDWWPTALFVAALAGRHLIVSMGIYVLAHKRDPFLIPGVLFAGLSAALVWRLGSWYGSSGAAIGYLSVMLVFNLPCWFWIWHQSRRMWHGTIKHSSSRQ